MDLDVIYVCTIWYICIPFRDFSLLVVRYNIQKAIFFYSFTGQLLVSMCQTCNTVFFVPSSCTIQTEDLKNKRYSQYNKWYYTLILMHINPMKETFHKSQKPSPQCYKLSACYGLPFHRGKWSEKARSINTLRSQLHKNATFSYSDTHHTKSQWINWTVRSNTRPYYVQLAPHMARPENLWLTPHICQIQ